MWSDLDLVAVDPYGSVVVGWGPLWYSMVVKKCLGVQAEDTWMNQNLRFVRVFLTPDATALVTRGLKSWVLRD